eukprot:142102_1
MGANCAGQCCSSDQMNEMRMKSYLHPDPKKQHNPVSLERALSSTYTTTLTPGSSEPIVSRNSIIEMDTKTIELLSNLELFGPSTPVKNPDEPQPQFEPKPQPEAPSTIQGLVKDEPFELHEIERNVSVTRVKALEDVTDTQELEHLMDEQYRDHITSVVEEDDESTESSSLPEEEILEIQRRKSNQSVLQSNQPSVPGPKLYRDQTASTWHEQEISQLQEDMEQQLASLRNQNSADFPDLPTDLPA